MRIHTWLLLVLVWSLGGSTTQAQNVMTPSSDYNAAWARADSLEREGLPESAREVVDTIYADAKAEGHQPQVIKALLYQVKYVVYLEEDAVNTVMARIREEVAASEPPVQAVLHSYLGELYFRYYQQQRWQFHNRTTTDTVDEGDVETWDTHTILSRAVAAYLQSVASVDILQATPVEAYAAVLSAYEYSRALRPTLYDLLAFRAVDFLSNSEASLITPEQTFVLDDPAYFEPAAAFAGLVEPEPDALAPAPNAVRILQMLLTFHLDDDDPAALVDADLKRLKLVYDHAAIPDKDALYQQALETLQQTYADDPAGTEATFALAQLYDEQANQYQPGGPETYRWKRRDAYNLCGEAIEAFPQAWGASNCRALQASIGQKELQLTTEEAQVPGQPLLARLNFRNLRDVYVKAVHATPEDQQQLQRANYQQRLEILRRLAARPAVVETSYLIPNEGDYQRHGTELSVPALERGSYLLLASTNADYSFNEEALGYAFFQVSNISYLARRHNDGTYDVYVLNRETGAPLPGAQVRLRYQDSRGAWDVVTQLWSGSERTDSNGFVRIEPQQQRSFKLHFSHRSDSLISNESFYGYGYRGSETSRLVTHFFTDRAIYRPGQTIYFKGILMYQEGERYEIRPEQSTVVTFYDVNHQQVETMTLVSNEYGTFSGSFVAPSGGLLGNMSINNGYGSTSFSVEEYKRPRFEVTMEPPADAPALYDLATVTGKAESYAGANIDGAEVTYRVVRTPRWLPWYRRWYWPTGGQEVEIAHGTTTTDEVGAFTIQFEALPDRSLPESEGLQFNYRITTDVTDITGETHSATTNVTVGYRSLVLGLNVPDRLDKTTFGELVVSANNLNGKPQPTQGQLTVVRLQPPAHYFRAELWDTPDEHVLSEATFTDAFPLDDYAGEDDPADWEVAETVLTLDFDTAESTMLDLSQIDEWDSGAYRLELSANDPQGRPVSFQQVTTLFAPTDDAPPVPLADWFVPLKSGGEPGETASFLIGTSAENVRVLFEVEHRGEITESRWIRLSNSTEILTVPIEEQHRGNFGVHIAFVRDNRAYRHSQTISVPYTNRQLELKLATFRDKLKPGSEEEWKITVAGAQGDAVAAELVAAMYDASLDSFRPHNWYFNILSYHGARLGWGDASLRQTITTQLQADNWNPRYGFSHRSYDQLNWFGFDFYGRRRYARMAGAVAESAPPPAAAPAPMERQALNADAALSLEESAEGEESAQKALADDDARLDENVVAPVDERLADVQARTNLDETAFFFPHLETNAAGEVVFSFTMPEALTRWKLLAFGHSKDLKYGQLQHEVVTQKELMVVPNAPRFFRENDEIRFAAKVTNLSDTTLVGYARLLLFDALTMEPLDDELGNDDALLRFDVDAGRSTPLAWTLDIPEGLSAVTYRVVAEAGAFSDGEENVVPVLTNRTLVTETLPLPIRGNETKTFSFDKLRTSTSSTLRHHRFTLEYTPNPVWYAVQALPYLMEFPHECAEQTFSRFYANSIATGIVRKNPRIEQVYDQWRRDGAEALVSNLEKNQDLKGLMLDATPWVLHAQDETARKQRIATLFDTRRMDGEMQSALRKLEQMQYGDGSWPWFNGGRPDRYITQHIAKGLGHLLTLDVLTPASEDRVIGMLNSAIRFLDVKIREDYDRLLEANIDLEKHHLNGMQIHYLYTRSLFPDLSMTDAQREAHAYYRGQAQEYWLNHNRLLQGMIALALHRTADAETPDAIVASLREFALHDDELGMYWKRDYGYYWYQAPIETQSLLIEVFHEVAQDEDAVEEMKQWLLKQKQTQDWRTTKATAAAVYALLLRGTDLTAVDSDVVITLGEYVIDSSEREDREAGTGYFQTAWDGSSVTPEMGDISVQKQGEGIGWGAVYWQYFEQLDKITPAETPLSIEKEVMLQRNTPTGPQLVSLDEGTTLTPGDLLKVRVVLRTDRNLEYVHMKDMRASGLEPVNVLSQYKWQDGLGYYESTRDAATHFFFGYLPQGTYVFEYPLRVAHAGDFSNGITTVQCMYAPEFSAHSEGTRIQVAAPETSEEAVAGDD